MSKNTALALAIRTIAAARKAGLKAGKIREFLDDNGIERDALEDMLRRGAMDEGNVSRALGELAHVPRKKPNAPAVEAAPAKKAPAKKAPAKKAKKK